MRGDSAEQRACPFLVKDAPRQTLGRSQSTKTERGKGEGVTRPGHGTECGSFKARPVVHDTTEQPCVRRAIGPKTGGRLLDRAFDNCRRSIVERVSELGRRLDEFESILL